LLPEIPVRKTLRPGAGFGDPAGETVALLTGCVMDIFYNPVHWDTIEVLAANGYWVIIPEQGCCGALAHHAGETDITRKLAEELVEKTMRVNPQWIVVNSAGCGSSMKEYGRLLSSNPVIAEKAALFSERLVDVMALLAQKPMAPFRNYALHEKVTYHAACHLYHVQKVKQEPMALLAQVPGIELVPLTSMEACCGSAGIFNVEHPELSGEILDMKMEHLQTACHQGGASTVATGNPGCMLQLEKGIQDRHLPMRVRHPISILAEAYRAPQSAGAIHKKGKRQ
jgi:glycolate oxidase iron-sulfur subunit